jgi:hypothetical protein
MREPLALDGLLMLVVARRLRLLAPRSPNEIVPIEIPVAMSDCGRVHLCSSALVQRERSAVRYKQRRAPAQEFARLGNAKIKRVDIAAGVNKSHRVPYSWQLLAGDKLDWFAIGDASGIRDLLAEVHYLGKHTGSGKGKLREQDAWEIRECESWPGFPVVLDGKPLRNLPLDWPGLVKPRTAVRCVRPPYWMRMSEELCAIPAT